MAGDRFDRQIRFFGRDGQDQLRATRPAVVGVGGVGTHVVQQLALLGVGEITLIDGEHLEETNRNRYVGVRRTDAVPETRKVDTAARLVNEIDPSVPVRALGESLLSEHALARVVGATHVFGCVDREGVRLVLTEACAAYNLPYIDVASDIIPGTPPEYGGQVCVAWDGQGCLVCFGLLDAVEAGEDLAGLDEHRERDAIYCVERGLLDRSGPSVVSINGVVASLAVTEFLVGVTGVRRPQAVLTYRGSRGIVTVVGTDERQADCYYCCGIRGACDAADIGRYTR